MLRLHHLRLTQFKNYPKGDYDFRERVVGIAGPNGVGKTNLLDAIHTLCFSRGYFSRSDQLLVMHGAVGYRLDGIIQRDSKKHHVGIVLRENGKKEISIDQDLLPRLSDHLGRFPVVMIAPDDAELITGESKARRQFLDALICQLEPTYMPALSKCNRILQQRQALLRECAESGCNSTRLSLLDVIDQQWADIIQIILPAREKWTTLLRERMIEQYCTLAGFKDKVDMKWHANIRPGDILAQILANRSTDIAAQRNTVGPQRDDIHFELGTHPFKQVASQGQRKTLLFSLKLAERSLLEDQLSISPILLLDDVFEKLDPIRIQSLLTWVAINTHSQVFISDTDADRLREQLEPLKIDWQLIQVDEKS